ncbi:glutathione-dependent formaldehyde-activating enzyme domain-containing protein [Hirsutella rhossiliensis]|uniref:Glutathione-dependent formaldehyde-activating enzyme domain-containing protein n=1 Tax=Hirsutella rhossiliensis TaxID=111463 RepID=A0A9P8SDN9_9HYPO|nr:glutathione-dependent formaldehyde-activating enzyme domain-containing protein [Hirsutella rhossiliensis]KAH0957545.1 glutathione-dependent formaldehyde-activating enzyme domain-containing protein [Hirsutella rhossiliensis]
MASVQIQAYKPVVGTCLCGSVSVTILDEEWSSTQTRGHLCHCRNCQKASGSVVAANLIIEESRVDISDKSGTLKTYNDLDTSSGRPVIRTFCGVDGR